MGFLSVIRRGALRDKMPIREIARRTGLSRKTIEKYLHEGVVEPKFKTPSRPSKLDSYADRLSVSLLACGLAALWRSFAFQASGHCHRQQQQHEGLYAFRPRQ